MIAIVIAGSRPAAGSRRQQGHVGSISRGTQEYAVAAAARVKQDATSRVKQENASKKILVGLLFTFYQV